MSWSRRMTKEQLLEYGEEQGYEMDVDMDDTKDDIVAALKAAEAEPVEEEEPEEEPAPKRSKKAKRSKKVGTKPKVRKKKKQKHSRFRKDNGDDPDHSRWRNNRAEKLWPEEFEEADEPEEVEIDDEE